MSAFDVLGRGVRRHPLVAFALLACAFSWAWWIPLAVRGDTVTDGVGVPTHLPGLLGPLLAAVLVSAVEGRASLRGLLHRMVAPRVPARLWVLLVATLAVGACGVVASGRRPGSADAFAYSGIGRLNPVLVVVLVVLVNGMGEETGWRGFLVDRLLQRHGALSTAFITTAVWGTWHLPMFFFVGGLQSLGPAVVGWAVGLACGSIVLTWLYVTSGRSVLYCALWHSAFNLTTATAATTGTPSAVTSTAVMVLAGVLVVRLLRQRRAGMDLPPEPATTARA